MQTAVVRTDDSMNDQKYGEKLRHPEGVFQCAIKFCSCRSISSICNNKFVQEYFRIEVSQSLRDVQVTSRRSWKSLLQRGTSGLPYPACCRRDPAPKEQKMGGWLQVVW